MGFRWGLNCLAPVLANIILTEFEKQIIEDLIKSGTIKFYRRYVGDTLVLIKPCDILSCYGNSTVSTKIFTVDAFENEKVHFLDLEISKSGTDVFRKSTHTGQYIPIFIVPNRGLVKQLGLSHCFVAQYVYAVTRFYLTNKSL